MKPKLSVVITSYNEKENLQRGVLQEMLDFLASAKFSWEVIINDDGSTDGGDKIVEKFCRAHKGFKLVHGHHAGKAAGLYNGIKESNGEIILTTDVDQSTPLREVSKLLPWFDQGYDVVFGSRGTGRMNFPWYRKIMSWGFRTFRQLFLLRHITDTQCGFKAYRGDLLKKIFPKLSVLKRTGVVKGWTVSAFDVELLFLAEKAGYKLKEVDVEWFQQDTSTSKEHDFLKESADMLQQIITVKINDLKGFYN